MSLLNFSANAVCGPTSAAADSIYRLPMTVVATARRGDLLIRLREDDLPSLAIAGSRFAELWLSAMVRSR